MDTFCDYKITKKLGEGGFGSVVEAKGPKNNTVAIKLICTDQKGSSYKSVGICEAVEIDILSKFKHPCVLSALEVLTPESCPNAQQAVGIVLPKMRSVPRDVVSVPLKKRLKWCFDLACGIAFLHRRDIIHGDIKPDNLLLDESMSKAVVSDFGICVYSVNGLYASIPPSIVGTSVYIAPEVFSRFRSRVTPMIISNKVDVWAYALTVLSLLIGEEKALVLKTEGEILENAQRMETVGGRRGFVTFLLSEGGLDSSSLYPSLVDLLVPLFNPDPRERPSMNFVISHPLFSEFRVQRGAVRTLKNRGRIPEPSMEFIFYIGNFLIAETDATTTKISIFFLAVDLFYQCYRLWRNDEGVIFFCLACILLAESLVDSYPQEIHHILDVWNKSEKTRITGISQEDIFERVPSAQSQIVLHLSGILYRPYLYHRCSTIEELRWCVENVVGNPQIYLNINLDSLPKIPGKPKTESTSIDEVFREEW
jgi:serine/threonine protein kinase